MLDFLQFNHTPGKSRALPVQSVSVGIKGERVDDYSRAA
jgi:hypothetical protein